MSKKRQLMFFLWWYEKLFSLSLRSKAFFVKIIFRRINTTDWSKCCFEIVIFHYKRMVSVETSYLLLFTLKYFLSSVGISRHDHQLKIFLQHYFENILKYINLALFFNKNEWQICRSRGVIWQSILTLLQLLFRSICNSLKEKTKTKILLYEKYK